MMKRTILRGFAALLAGLAAALPAWSQTYPTKPIRIIVPVPAGGAMDVTTRLVAVKMGEKLGQSIIVENRPGGDTILGTRVVKDAPADGYTILAQSNTFSSQPALKVNPGYDPIKDFTPLGPMVRGAVVVELGSVQPDKTLTDFIERARKSQLSYGSPGIGSAPHLAAAMLMKKLGVDVLHAPYKGASAAYPDVISGRVGLFVDGYAGSAPYISSGKMRALAVTGQSRISVLPDVPTLVEQGIDMTYSYWLGLIVKAGTPREVVEKLSDALKYATSSKELVERFRADGVDPTFMTPAEFRDHVAKDVAESSRIITDLKIPKE